MNRLAVLVVVALGGTVLLGACSGGGDDTPADSDASNSAVLAERMGCRSGSYVHDPDRGWQEADVHDCRDGMTARIYGSLTVPERDAAVRLLSMESSDQSGDVEDSCSDFGPSDEELYIVAGDTWVAVVSGQQDARDAADLLGGELQPGSLDAPSDSALGSPCLPGT
jgi:hypothetical protein